jgi:hypothetical protein
MRAMVRDMAAAVLANLALFGVGEALYAACGSFPI